MKRITLVTLAVCLAAASGCRLGGPRADGSGSIECTQVDVAPLVAGRILDLPVEEGMVVTQGQVVARLDICDAELRRDEARAARAMARSAQQVAALENERIKRLYESKTYSEQQRDEAAAVAAQTVAAVDQAAARLALWEKAVADGTVVAPRDGTVTVKVREAGEYVNAGLPLLTLSRLDEVWLALYVPEDRLSRVKLGASATVRVDGDAKAYRGTITFVSPEAEFTPRNAQTPDERAKLVYRVKVTLPNPDGVFKPGMPADGYLE